MKKIVATLILSSLISASVALAAPPAREGERSKAPSRAVALVEQEVVRPLRARDQGRSRFSRMRTPPDERRVRILDRAALTDATGAAFVRYAIDARSHYAETNEWRRATVVGCVYVETGRVYVQLGGTTKPASTLSGGSDEAPAEACIGAERAAR